MHTLVTLGTPHAGTYSAYALPSRLCRQLRPGSELMRELAEPVPDCRTRFVAYWSDLDQMVLPQRHARLDHPDLPAANVEMHGLGHMSLPISGRVVHGISTTLAHLDTDGSTLAAGVTTIAGPAGTGPAPTPRPEAAAHPPRPPLAGARGSTGPTVRHSLRDFGSRNGHASLDAFRVSCP